ncbi:MAG: hypothetical protein ACRCSO_13290 [Sphingomonas sp.]
MQIDIDFDVYKELTRRRRDEQDSYNDVLRRVLSLSEADKPKINANDEVKSDPINSLVRILHPEIGSPKGAWIGNVFFPEGTKFRATYKGRTYRAEIRDERWRDEDGLIRRSPSEAAGSISGTQVNGWRFWFAKRPTDEDWYRLDELRK